MVTAPCPLIVNSAVKDFKIFFMHWKEMSELTSKQLSDIDPLASVYQMA